MSISLEYVEDIIHPAIIGISLEEHVEDVLCFSRINFCLEKDVKLFNQFYCDLFAPAFPDKDECDSIESIMDQSGRFSVMEGEEFFVILAIRGTKIVGGVIAEYFSKSNCGMIDYIVVSKDERGKKLGTRIIDYVIDVMSKSAKSYKEFNSGIDYCFFEVEDPDKVKQKMESSSDEMNLVRVEEAYDRINFWSHMAAEAITVDYYHPAIGNDQSVVDYLSLCVLECANGKRWSWKEKIAKKTLIDFVNEYFWSAYNIQNVKDDECYKKIACSVQGVEQVVLVPISTKALHREKSKMY